MKNCPFCGEQIQDTAHKCRFCGEWIDKQCPECGNWSRFNVAVCPECGYPFKGESNAQKEESVELPRKEETVSGPIGEVKPEDAEQVVAETAEQVATESAEQVATNAAEEDKGSKNSLRLKGWLYRGLSYIAVAASCFAVVALALEMFKYKTSIDEEEEKVFTAIIAASLLASGGLLFLLKRRFEKPVSVALDWVASLYVLTAITGYVDVSKWIMFALLVGHGVTRGAAAYSLLNRNQANATKDSSYLGRLWGVETAALLLLACVIFFIPQNDMNMGFLFLVILFAWPIATILEAGLAEKILSARADYGVLISLFYVLLLGIAAFARAYWH